MDFVLGILTGFSTAYFIGWSLLRHKKKTSGVPKNSNPPPVPPRANSLGIYLDGQRIAMLNPMTLISDEMSQYPPYPVTVVRSLEDLLKIAIENDDFEEAARIRDLMNKQ